MVWTSLQTQISWCEHFCKPSFFQCGLFFDNTISMPVAGNIEKENECKNALIRINCKNTIVTHPVYMLSLFDAVIFQFHNNYLQM